ncbi:hypothetical protein RUMOBE_03346 [Blautia obeum ATCC 29174]|uniref:Uncharacterized protein n=1 Tax=Blautia obeum ATCC 29174 TaxID=411459 RepID=A5ZWF2_9FIRM|nr:hypothetical protein RUMOBE_03346 [Blautia obeum ATCC 29174]
MCCKDKLAIIFPSKILCKFFALVLNCYQYTEFAVRNKEKNHTKISEVS